MWRPLWILALLNVALTSSARRGVPNFSIKPPQLGRERIRYTTEYTCEGRELNISCPDNYQIHLVRANYGRLSIGICNDHGRLDWSVTCMSYRSFLIMQDRCAHKSSCGTLVSSSLFGDPCPGTLKYLEMQYHCVLATTAPTPSGAVREHPRAPLHGSPSGNATGAPQPGGPTPAPGREPGAKPRPPVRLDDDIPSPSSSSSSTTTTTAPPSTTASTTRWSATLGSGVRTAAPGVTPDGVSSFPTWQKATPRSTSRPRSTTPSEPSFVPVEGPLSREEYCAPTTARELHWNWTRAGNTVAQKCPGGATGIARWLCSSDGPRWLPDKPDLRQCRSPWVDNLRERLEGGESIISVALDLSLMTQTKSLFSQDVKQIAAIVQQMLSKAVSSMETFLDAWHREQVFKELLDAISETASNLLEQKQRVAWYDLSSADQKQVLTMLMAALEESALLLADSFSSENFFPVVKSNVLLSVKVIDSRWTMNIQFPSYAEAQKDRGDHWTGIQDSVLLPVESITQFTKHGLGKVVFIAYNGVEDFLRPDLPPTSGGEGYVADDAYADRSDSLFDSRSHVVNSRVVAASVGRHRNTHLPQPITVTLKHIQEKNVTDPQCVFWNYDMQMWSTEGCWVQSFNATHTTCACDHLTSFAVLMEVQPMQAYSSYSSFLKVTVIVGCVIAIVFLLLTFVLLYALSFKKNDGLWIHRNLVLCLLVSEFVFVCGINQTHLPVFCGVVAGLLHYFLLVAFAWMFLEGFQLYVTLVEALDVRRSRVGWYCGLAYITPALVVSVAALIDPYSFGTREYCWLEAENYFIFSFVGPCVGVIFGCVIFLCISGCVLCHRGSVSTAVKCKEETKLKNIGSGIWWAIFLVAVMTFTWGAGIVYVVKYTAVWAYLFSVLNGIEGLFLLLFCCWRNDTVQDEVRRLLKDVSWLPSCLRGSPASEDAPPRVLANGTTAQLSVVQQSWNSQDKSSTVIPKFIIPGRQSTDTMTSAGRPAPAQPSRDSNGARENPNVSGTLRRSSASDNISAIDANKPDGEAANEQQRPQQHHRVGTPNGLRSWSHRRPYHGHYSDASSVYAAYADHIYESIDGDAASSVDRLSIDRFSDVPPPAPVETFYGDLSDLSQHSSSSYGYDQRPLLVAPLPGKFQAAPLAQVVQGFARDSRGSPEPQLYCTEQRLRTPGRRKLSDEVYASHLYSPQLLYEATLVQSLGGANFVPESVGDGDWGTGALPDLLHAPPDGPVVMAVLDGEKVISRLRPEVVAAVTDARLQQQQRYNLSTYC